MTIFSFGVILKLDPKLDSEYFLSLTIDYLSQFLLLTTGTGKNFCSLDSLFMDFSSESSDTMLKPGFSAYFNSLLESGLVAINY